MLSGITIGDPHLGQLYNALGEDADKLQTKDMDRAAQIAYEQGLTEIFLLGDYSRRNLPPMATLALLRFLLKWDGKMNMHLILGNHDVEEEGEHSLRLFKLLESAGTFKTTFIYTEPTLKVIGGVPVSFLPFPHSKPLDKKGVVVAHLGINGALGDNGHEVTSEFDPDPDGHHWLIGHLHTYQKAKHWLYPGTLYQTSFGEGEDKFLTTFHYKMENGVLKKRIESDPFSPSFRLRTLTIETNDDLKQVTADPSIRYTLYLSMAVNLPLTFRNSHPNVVKLNKYKTNKELLVLRSEKHVEYDSDNQAFTVLDDLADILKSRNPELSKEQVLRCLEIAESLHKRLTNQE